MLNRTWLLGWGLLVLGCRALVTVSSMSLLVLGGRALVCATVRLLLLLAILARRRCLLAVGSLLLSVRLLLLISTVSLVVSHLIDVDVKKSEWSWKDGNVGLTFFNRGGAVLNCDHSFWEVYSFGSFAPHLPPSQTRFIVSFKQSRQLEATQEKKNKTRRGPHTNKGQRFIYSWTAFSNLESRSKNTNQVAHQFHGQLPDLYHIHESRGLRRQ